MRIARGLWPRGRLLRSPPAHADNLDGHPGKLLRKARGDFGVLGAVLPLWLPRDTCTLLRPVGRHEDGVRVVPRNCAPVVTPRACVLSTPRPTTETLSASISAGGASRCPTPSSRLDYIVVIQWRGGSRAAGQHRPATAGVSDVVTSRRRPGMRALQLRVVKMVTTW